MTYVYLVIGFMVGATLMFFVWQFCMLGVDRRRSREKLHDFAEEFPDITAAMKAEADAGRYYKSILKVLEDQQKRKLGPQIIERAPLWTILMSLWVGAVVVGVLGTVFAEADARATMIVILCWGGVLIAYRYLSGEPKLALEGPPHDPIVRHES